MPQRLSETVKRSDVAGCAVGILRQGQSPEFVFHGACGAGGEEIDRGVLWEAASLSKPVVALLAIEQLRDETLLTRTLSTDLSIAGRKRRYPLDGRDSFPSVDSHIAGAMAR